MAAFVFSNFNLVFFLFVAYFYLLGLYYFNTCTEHFIILQNKLQKQKGKVLQLKYLRNLAR